MVRTSNNRKSGPYDPFYAYSWWIPPDDHLIHRALGFACEGPGGKENAIRDEKEGGVASWLEGRPVGHTGHPRYQESLGKHAIEFYYRPDAETIAI